jgi:hypothetical protein
MKLFYLRSVLMLLCLTSPAASLAEELEASLARYRAKFKIENPDGSPNLYEFLKLPSELIGLRRVRAVLPGLVYRGGGNN